MPKIGIIGSQGVGKTTLIDALAEEDMFKGWVFCLSPTRYLYKVFGMDFHTANTEIQLATLFMQLNNMLLSTNVILDRTVIDNYAYLQYHLQKGETDLSSRTINFIQFMTRKLAHMIDLYIILEPEFALVNDGIRDVDIEQQKFVQEQIMKNLEEFEIDARKLYSVSGSVESRVIAVKRIISNLIEGEKEKTHE